MSNKGNNRRADTILCTHEDEVTIMYCSYCNDEQMDQKNIECIVLSIKRI
jgi:hypothetical protein